MPQAPQHFSTRAYVKYDRFAFRRYLKSHSYEKVKLLTELFEFLNKKPKTKEMTLGLFVQRSLRLANVKPVFYYNGLFQNILEPA